MPLLQMPEQRKLHMVGQWPSDLARAVLHMRVSLAT